MQSAYSSGAPMSREFESADAFYAQLKDFLLSKEVSDLRHDEVEGYLEQESRELLRRMFEEYLVIRTAKEPVHVVGEDGNERSWRRKKMRRSIGSIFGPVVLRRTGFHHAGLSYLFPADADLNLPAKKHTHTVAQRAVLHAIDGSFEGTVDWLRRTTGSTAGKRQVEELVVDSAVDFRAFYETRVCEESDDLNELIVLSFDGKGVVVRHEDLREKTRAKAEKKPKLDMRQTRGEKRTRKRMALVAAVYTIQPFSRTPTEFVRALRGTLPADAPRPPRAQNKRVWADMTADWNEVISDAFDEAQRRDPKHRRTWVVLVDGDKRVPPKIRQEARRRRIKIRLIYDLIHVVEYLWSAVHSFHSEGSTAAENWVVAHLTGILLGRALRVADAIEQEMLSANLGGTKRKRVCGCVTYLRRKSDNLGYRAALKHGLPITTSIIEGTCRHLIADRMDITGARWSLEGAQAMLQLRAIKLSRDFDAYWRFHVEAEHQRNHCCRYANGCPPTGKLRLV